MKKKIKNILFQELLKQARKHIRQYLTTNKKTGSIENLSNSTSEFEDGDAFVDQLKKDLALESIRINSDNVGGFLLNLITQMGRVQQFCAIQQLKRNKINAQCKTCIKRIDAAKEIVLVYLNQTFDERRKNFEQLFSLADKALLHTDPEQLILILEKIKQLADSSPFKDLQSVLNTQQALQDKDHEWDF